MMIRMKSSSYLLACLLVLGPTAWGAAADYEIVIAPDAVPVVRFAADEMAAFLGPVLGGDVVTVRAPTAGRRHVFLGTGPWSVPSGVTTNGLVRDAFRLVGRGGDVYIVGRDDASVDPRSRFNRGIWAQYYERGTLFGVYEFLERFAGVRLYFPGELGTVLPRREALDVPDGLDETVVPAFLVRRYSAYSDGEYFEGDRFCKISPVKNLNQLRLRMETTQIPCCHGQTHLRLLERFGESHPEYFMLDAKGRRGLDPSVARAGTICLTSGVWEEIYRDCEAYFTGKSRGYRWGANFMDGKYADIMCQDGLLRCSCERCARTLGTGRHWASEVVWSNTCAIARRLTENGIDGTVVQMAYTSYRGIPKTTDIPPNVRVMLAQRGPWTMHEPEILAADLKELDAWLDKVGGKKLWLWNYACKYRFLNLPGIPSMTPHAIGDYYRRVGPKILGAYLETEGDNFLQNHLNYVVFSRMAWHPETDVDAFLDEYYRLMYGAAAAEIKCAFETFERKWAVEIGNRTVDLPDGPLANPPCEHFIWHEIYSPAVIDGLERNFDRAARLVAPGSLEARRVALMRRELFEPLARRARAYVANAKPLTPAAGPDAVVLVSEDGRSVEKAFALDGKDGRWPRLEPFRRYRILFNIEADGLEPTDRGGGAAIEIRDGFAVGFPTYTAFNGTFARSRKVYEFFTGPEANRRGRRSVLRCRMYLARGRAVFDGIRIEEIPPQPGDVKPILSASVRDEGTDLVFTLNLDKPYMKMRHFRSAEMAGYLVYRTADGKVVKRPAQPYDKNRNPGILTGRIGKAKLPADVRAVDFELKDMHGRVCDFATLELKEASAP